MPNVAVIIEGENKRKLNSRNTPKKESKCNCPRNKNCPLNGECLSQNVICQATVTSGTDTETYVGLTASTFKARFGNHKASLNSETKHNATELSKHIWNLKENNLSYAITWKILCRAQNKAII